MTEHPSSLLSKIGRSLLSRAFDIGQDLKQLSDQLRLNTKFDAISETESVYLISHTSFSSFGVVKFSAGYRLVPKASPKLYLKIDFGTKSAGAYPKASDMTGFQLGDDNLIRLWGFCSGRVQKITISQQGLNAVNPVDVEFIANTHDESLLNIRSGSTFFSHSLGPSDLLDIKSCILAVKQMKYFYLSDTAVLNLLNDSANQCEIISGSAGSSPEYLGDTDAAFLAMKVPVSVIKKSEFKSWVMRQNPGIDILSSKSKALWAIGNQKLNADPVALENISVIQSFGSNAFAAEIIDRVNSGDIDFLKSMVMKEYLDE